MKRKTTLGSMSFLYNKLCGRKDVLTGIGNRNYLKSKYNKTPIDFQKQVYFLYISFQNEIVLQRSGDSISQQIKKEAAYILNEKCDNNDVVARVDDAGFGIIMSCANILELQKRTLQIVNSLNSYMSSLLKGVKAPFRCGFCCVTSDLSFEDALSNAQIAYENANDGEKSICAFSDSMIQKSKVQNILKQKLQNAMEQNEFSVYLQFIFDVKKEKFVGAEALARWNSFEEGLVMPATFIKQLYSVNLIEKFDLYMLDKVCALLEKWSDDSDMSGLRISCNVTRVSISSKNFLENFKSILKKYNFNKSNLMLEITEDALIDNQAVAYRNIIGCREEGLRIALDDFGAGNSSFRDINNYLVDEIKIDRSFISSACNERGSLVLDGLIKMAHALNIDIVCEGVETETQRDVAKKLGSDYIQGHYYSLVYPIEEAKEHYMSSTTTSVTM